MHGVVSCSFIHHRSSICSDHVPSSTAEYQLTNTVKIKQCSCVMQGLSILSFGNNLCILHKNLLFSVSLAKWAVVPHACEFSSIHWPKYRNGSLELRRSRFQLLYCQVKRIKTAKGVSFFPSFSNDSCFKLAYLSASWMSVLFGNFHLLRLCCTMITALNKNALRICVFKV